MKRNKKMLLSSILLIVLGTIPLKVQAGAVSKGILYFVEFVLGGGKSKYVAFEGKVMNMGSSGGTHLHMKSQPVPGMSQVRESGLDRIEANTSKGMRSLNVYTDDKLAEQIEMQRAMGRLNQK